MSTLPHAASLWNKKNKQDCIDCWPQGTVNIQNFTNMEKSFYQGSLNVFICRFPVFHWLFSDIFCFRLIPKFSKSLASLIFQHNFQVAFSFNYADFGLRLFAKFPVNSHEFPNFPGFLDHQQPCSRSIDWFGGKSLFYTTVLMVQI